MMTLFNKVFSVCVCVCFGVIWNLKKIILALIDGELFG